MADEFCLDAAVTVKLLFKREDDQHALHEFAHLADAALLPGPELRADKVNDGDAEAMQLFGEAEMNLRKVDEHGHGGPALSDGTLELAELTIDARKMAHDFREAHDRHVFRADHDLDSGGGHARAAHAPLRGFTSWSRAVGERTGQQRPVELAAGFTR